MSGAAPFLTRARQALSAGRPADAIGALARAALLEPANAIIQHDLGLAYLEAGNASAAAAALRAAVDINPKYSDAYFRLGIALEKAGEFQAAVAAFERAVELLPSFAEAWFHAGALVFSLGHRAEAIGCFRRASAAGGKTVYGRLGSARALLAENRDADAEKQLRQLLALHKDNALALDLLANLLAESGRFDEAWSFYKRAIAAAPLMAGSYYDLVRCRRIADADSAVLADMEAALANPHLEREHLYRLHLAMGKTRDDLGDYAKAMQHFDAAEHVRRQIAPFDAGQFARQVDRLITLFSRDAFPPRQTTARGKPVLITGMPRSGTTLTEQILSSHPDVAGGGELNFWNERGLAWLQTARSAPDAEMLSNARTDYRAMLNDIGPGASRVTDKMPFNFLWAGLIHLACPEATIIHCKRNAMDTALSIHQTSFNRHVAFPTGGTELIAYINAHQKLTAHWHSVLPDDAFVELEYEALTADPEPEIRRLLSVCGLTWNEACLRPELNTRAVKTPSRWQTRQPINQQAVARWRRYEAHLGALAALLDREAVPDLAYS